MLINGQDLHQFSTHISQINLSFHQYLLSTDEPILIHTGNVKQAEVSSIFENVPNKVKH